MSLPAQVQLIEVGLRDGLQNEPHILPTEYKLKVIERLIAAGVRRIQVTSFVNPARVPQMADAEALCAALPSHDEVEYSGLVLNSKGLERLQATGLHAVDLGISASDTHSIKNTGQPTMTRLTETLQMIAAAREMGVRVRAGIQCAFGCAFEGAVPLERVLTIARAYIDCGIDELALADSTGMANPLQMTQTLAAVQVISDDTPIVLHLHDTRGMGLANVYAALQQGVTRFDTAFGGLGGCPFIPGATGNIATEDTVNMLQAMGIETGIDAAAISAIARDVGQQIGATLSGKVHRLI